MVSFAVFQLQARQVKKDDAAILALVIGAAFVLAAAAYTDWRLALAVVGAVLVWAGWRSI